MERLERILFYGDFPVFRRVRYRLHEVHKVREVREVLL